MFQTVELFNKIIRGLPLNHFFVTRWKHKLLNQNLLFNTATEIKQTSKKRDKSVKQILKAEKTLIYNIIQKFFLFVFQPW
jgi:hypothetical protein